MVVQRCFFTGLEGRKVEREVFFIYKTFSKLLLEARLGALQEKGLGLARHRVGIINVC